MIYSIMNHMPLILQVLGLIVSLLILNEFKIANEKK